MNSPTPEEISKARIDAGLTQAQSAKLVRSTTRAWQYWESGTRKIPKSTWELFNMKVKEKILVCKNPSDIDYATASTLEKAILKSNLNSDTLRWLICKLHINIQYMSYLEQKDGVQLLTKGLTKKGLIKPEFYVINENLKENE